MNGREVFKHAVRAMSESARQALASAGLEIDDVDWLVPHQANRRIIDAIGQRLGIAEEKVFMNLETYGNMSAASVPVALDEAVRSGSIKGGDIVLIIVFGGGFTWGASVLEWHG
jgi:3-oxoacyl-[acyl-carrier-protein] synthase-3